MENKFIKLLLGGNSFILNKPESEEDNITPEGWEEWSNADYVYGAYFKPAKDATVTIVMEMAESAKAASVIKATVGGVTTTVEIAKAHSQYAADCVSAIGSLLVSILFLCLSFLLLPDMCEAVVICNALKLKGGMYKFSNFWS